MVVDTERRRGVPLRIKVNNQNFCSKARKGSRYIDARRRFSDATLLVCHSNNPRSRRPRHRHIG
jgi:hypothetical protein